MKMTIFVGNLSFDVTNQMLRELFEEYGRLDRVHLCWDTENERSRGFGFVDMPDEAEAKNAISLLNNIDYCGRTIQVSPARPRNKPREYSPD
jgi:RNA recognition motif-containing protein